jgi:hypothetical protein
LTASLLEDSLQQEIEKESLDIVLGSIDYKENTMILCIDSFSGSTVDEGEKFINDHPVINLANIRRYCSSYDYINISY